MGENLENVVEVICGLSLGRLRALPLDGHHLQLQVVRLVVALEEHNRLALEERKENISLSLGME